MTFRAGFVLYDLALAKYADSFCTYEFPSLEHVCIPMLKTNYMYPSKPKTLLNPETQEVLSKHTCTQRVDSK